MCEPDPTLLNKTLAMYIDVGLTKRKYKKLCLYNKEMGGVRYPPYKNVVKAKEQCYPQQMDSSDFGADVDFISVIEHTIKRILLSLDKNELSKLQEQELVF